LGSATIIGSFFYFKNRRKLYNYLLLYLNIADFFWVFWHFTNHIDAVSNGHVTYNKMFCTAMGMFTHLGIGWELMWLMTIATYSAIVMYRLQDGNLSTWRPSDKTKKIVFCVCWGFPLIWWVIFGVSTDSYVSTGYYCWVSSETWKPWVFADGPLIVCFAYVCGCYGYVITVLIKQGNVKKSLFGNTYSKEIKRYLMYIVVYTLWIHPYLGITIMGEIEPINYLFWLYFLAMVNSIGTFNFIAYGLSEGWWKRLKDGKLFTRTAYGTDTEKGSSKSVQMASGSSSTDESD